MAAIMPSLMTISTVASPSMTGTSTCSTVTAVTVALLSTKRAAFGGDMKE
jgi:hypothetical protein